MGLFQHKQSQNNPVDDAQAAQDATEQHFLDANFREELRNHGRLYFEKVINENAALFKQDLDATIAQVNETLKDTITKQLGETIAQIDVAVKEQVTKQLSDQLTEYTKAMKEAQDATLASLTQGAQALQQQHQQLSQELQKSISQQAATFETASKESQAQLAAMKKSQESVLQALIADAQALQEQVRGLAVNLQKNVESQEDALVSSFQENMAQVIEGYLLEALGDQYDIKSQLPAIIKQMEANKQAMMDDVKL